jgi:hypothetical protein
MQQLFQEGKSRQLIAQPSIQSNQRSACSQSSLLVLTEIYTSLASSFVEPGILIVGRVLRQLSCQMSIFHLWPESPPERPVAG